MKRTGANRKLTFFGRRLRPITFRKAPVRPRARLGAERFAK
jgi:hypothetical protein